MAGLPFNCPYCNSDVEVSERNLKLTLRNRNKMGGKALAACPKCCRVIEVTGPLADDVQEWNPEVNDDCCCVPFLEDAAIRIPNGIINEGGVKYRPGGGGPLRGKWEYMHEYGMDPECYFRPSSGE